MSIEIKWENVATKFNYVLTDGKNIKFVTDEPYWQFGYFVVAEGENKGEYNITSWELHGRQPSQFIILSSSSSRKSSWSI